MPEFWGRFRERIPIAALTPTGQGLVAGLLQQRDGAWFLQDSSGVFRLPQTAMDALNASAPAWVAMQLGADGRVELCHHQALALDSQLQGALARADRLRQRLAIHGEIRAFFREQSFLEVDTPLAVPNPGSEPYLDTFPVDGLWLRTSPELHMKRLLGLGLDNIFQMGPCFRKGDRGHWHREEFHMLEWYRCFADLDHIANDLTGLFHRLAPFAQDPDYFAREPERVTCAELFARHLGLELRDHEDKAPLRQALSARGIETLEEDDWDTLYFLLFLNFIEGKLGLERPTFVSHYPASQAALAKRAPVQPGQMPSCYRMEVYLRGGIELANGFYELTDAAEQRARFAEDRARRQAMGKPCYADDPAFLATLERGLPPCAGIALGVDRFVACLLGASTLDEILPFPPGA